jgi:hypothetical protein
VGDVSSLLLCCSSTNSSALSLTMLNPLTKASQKAENPIPSISRTITTNRIIVPSPMSMHHRFCVSMSFQTRDTKPLSSCTIDNFKESSSLLHKSGLIFQLGTEHYKFSQTRIREM